MRAARKSDSVTLTAARHQHDTIDVVPTEAAGVTAHRVRTPFALDRYHARGELAPGEPVENNRRYDAGERLRADWTRAGLEPAVVARYRDLVSGGVSGGGGLRHDVHAHRMDAHRAWKKAIQKVGPIASNEVIEACCLGNAVRGKVRLEILRRGLAVLADHYGL